MIEAGEVHVIHAQAADVPLDLAILSEGEKNRASRFVFERERRRYTAARCALRRVLAHYTGTEPHAIKFEYNQYGRPSLATVGQAVSPVQNAPGAPLRFSLSHTSDLLLIAVAAGIEIGVDAERILPGIAEENIARMFFTQEELAAFLASPADSRPAVFFRTWARKEAYLKAIGHGLTERAVPIDPSWTVLDLDYGPEWAAALAEERPDCRIIHRKLES